MLKGDVWVITSKKEMTLRFHKDAKCNHARRYTNEKYVGLWRSVGLSHNIPRLVRRLCDKARNLTKESFNLPFAPSQILQFSRKRHAVQVCFLFSGSCKEKDWLQAPVILEVPKAQDYRQDPGCHCSQEVLSEEPLYSYLSPVRKKNTHVCLFVCLFVLTFSLKDGLRRHNVWFKWLPLIYSNLVWDNKFFSVFVSKTRLVSLF